MRDPSDADWRGAAGAPACRVTPHRMLVGTGYVTRNHPRGMGLLPHDQRRHRPRRWTASPNSCQLRHARPRSAWQTHRKLTSRARMLATHCPPLPRRAPTPGRCSWIIVIIHQKRRRFHQMNHRCPHSGSLAMLRTAEICCLNSGYVVPGRTEPAAAPGLHRGHSVRSGDSIWCGRKGRRSTVYCSSGLTKSFSSASTRRWTLIPRLR